MGLDAYFAIRFKKVPTESQIKQLRFHLLHRFPGILHGEQIILPAEHSIGDDDGDLYPVDGRLFLIDTMECYYGPGYERGPGLEISALLFYLTQRDDLEEVFYGGDADYRKITGKDALDLFGHWIVNGGLPYHMGFSYLDDEGTAPVCQSCDMPMSNVGGGRSLSYWACLGCERRVITQMGNPEVLAELKEEEDFFTKRREVETERG